MPRTKYSIDRGRSGKSDRESMSLASEGGQGSKSRASEEDRGGRNIKGDPLEDSDSDSEHNFAPNSKTPTKGGADTQDPDGDDEDDDSSEDDDDNEHPMESESEDEPTPTPRRPVAAKQRPTTRSNTITPKTPASARSRRSTIQEEEDEEDDDDDEFEQSEEASPNSESDEEFEDEEAVPVKRKRQSERQAVSRSARPQRATRGRQVGSIKEEEASLIDSDEEESEEEAPRKRNTVATKKGRTRQPVKTASATKRQTPTRKVARKKAASYQQDTLADLPSPRRSSAIKARNKVKSVANIEEKGSDQDVDSDEYSGDASESEAEEIVQKKPARRTPAKKKAMASSDEEFQVDSESNASSSEEASVSDALDDSDVEVLEKSDRMSGNISDDDEGSDDGKAINIDNEQVGTADDSSDDDITFSSSNKKSGTAEIRPSPRKGRYQGLESSSSEEDADCDDNNASKNHRPPGLPACPSTHDAITAEDLPRRHICYISPDGRSRQCFQLETLRQIALKSVQLQLRTDLDGKQRQNFLQPPHFRTAASDDLLDQIASRFGRDALDLHGPFYKKQNNIPARLQLEESSDDDHDVYALANLRDRMQSYFQNSMGSQDVYVCPLCYGQSHRLIVNPDASDDEMVALEGTYDPMHVLGNLDKDEFAVASQFCFTRASDVKKHLRSEHVIDTRDVQGNDLYTRWKIRAPDGLLQRWLTYHYNHKPKQGYMRMYWGDGNNQSFIHLLDSIKRVKILAEIASDPEANENEKEQAEEYLHKAESYYDSFSSIASALWKSIASPFAEAAVYMNEFIVEDGDVEEAESGEDDKPNHAALHRKLAAKDEESDANDLVHKLQRKYADENNEEEDEESVVNDQSSEDELEIVKTKGRMQENINDKEEADIYGDGEEEEDDDVEEIPKGYYSPIEEEQDEWMLSRLARRKRNSLSTPSLQQDLKAKRRAK